MTNLIATVESVLIAWVIDVNAKIGSMLFLTCLLKLLILAKGFELEQTQGTHWCVRNLALNLIA